MVMDKKGFVAILGLSIALVTVRAACTDELGDTYVGFAQCLTNKNVTMYGAYWCPHCANQKKLFGTQGFEKVKYVECAVGGPSAQPVLCTEKKIEGYPTWIFPDGSRLQGEISLEELSKKGVCSLPPTPNA